MRSGTLAAPRGTTWIPIEKEARRAPWWSPTSPVIAAALVVALIVALGASFIWTQRPTEAPTPAHGFAVASPSATPDRGAGWKDLFVVTDDADLTATTDGPFAVAVLDDDGLTLPVGDGTVTIPDVTGVRHTRVPGQILIGRNDKSRSVIDLATGDVLFDIPPFRTGTQQGWDYVILPSDDALTDWQLIDLATGDTRMLSDIVDLPPDSAVMPRGDAPRQIIDTADVIRVEAGRMDGLRWIASDPDAATFVIPGSLDRAISIPDYPTARDSAGFPVAAISDDGTAFAYETRAGDDRIVVLDTASGEELARFGVDQVGNDPSLAGFAEDGRLIAGTGDRLVAIDHTAGDPVSTIADGFERLASPILYAPDGLVYAKQVDALLRIDLATGAVTEVATGLVPGQIGFTRQGSPWITFLAQNGQTLLDARTGEIVSQMKPPTSTQVALYESGYAPGWETSGDGSTLIFATELWPEGRSAWLLSPKKPDGLKLTVPADSGGFSFAVSQDGQCVYAMRGGSGDPGALWISQISADPEWTKFSGNIDIVASFAFPAGTDPRTLPAQDFASPEASPVAESKSSAVMVIEGTAGEARVDGGIRIATLGDDGLTLPVGGEIVTMSDATQVRTIWGHSDRLHVIRDDDTEAVIDLASGDVLFEVEPFQNWTRDFGRWHFVPTDDTLADWTVTDMTTGDTHLLSELIDLPGDTGVMPSTPPEIFPGDAQVFHLELGTPETTGWVTTDPAARTFVIAGSLDRVTLLPDYPTLRDNVGSPTLIASADGEMVAYETRAGDSRIVALDVASGRVLARYSATEVGDNPTLAGFDTEGRIIVTSGDRIMALVPGASETVSVVAQDDSAERFDNPLVHAASGAVYVRDVDRLLRFDLETGVGTEIATDLLPDRFGFTKPGSDWIVLPTRDRVMLLDATTGTVASQVWPPGFGPGPADIERYSGWVDGDGNTYIVLFEPQQANGTITLLSTAFPDGLQIAGPADAELGQVWLSPDGETLYAYTSERLSGPGTIWQTPLGEEPDWQPVVEDVTPLPNPMMFFPEG